MLLRMYGARGAFPTSTDQMISFALFSDHGNLLIDVGSTSIFSDEKAISSIDHVIVSHTHHDHVALLPHFLISRRHHYLENHKDFKKCSILSPEPVTEILQSMSIREDDLSVTIHNPPSSFAGYTIDVIQTLHPRKNYCYKIHSETTTVIYTGDTAFFPELEKFCLGADVLICEASYDEKSTDLANYWGHMTPQGIARLVCSSNPRLTILTHFCVSNPETITNAVKRLVSVPESVIQGYDGLCLELSDL